MLLYWECERIFFFWFHTSLPNTIHLKIDIARYIECLNLARNTMKSYRIIFKFWQHVSIVFAMKEYSTEGFEKLWINIYFLLLSGKCFGIVPCPNSNKLPTYIYTLDILFSSNHEIHKSSHGLYFWASDLLIERLQ